MQAAPDDEHGGGPGLAEAVQEPASRRRFLALMGAGGAAGGAALLSACGGESQAEKSRAVQRKEVETSQFGPGDLGIVNFALLLELFEEDFYKVVLDSGEVKNRRIRNLLEEIYKNEQEHADALKATVVQLGGTAVAKPKTKFDDVLAGGEEMILSTAATIENLGASAYLGQADKVQAESILDAALRIHTIEARHAAALNHLAGREFKGNNALEGSIPDGAFAKPMSAKAVLREANKFIVQQ